MRPLMALACMTTGAGILLAAAGRRFATRYVLILPFVIGAWAIVRALFEAGWGYPPSLPFEQAPGGRFAWGGPEPLPAVALLLLIATSFTVASPSRAIRRATVTLASLAITMSIISGGLVLLGFSPAHPEHGPALMPLSASLAIALLAMAVIALRRHYAWPRRPVSGFGAGTLLWCLILSISLPVLSALARFWAEQPGGFSPELVEILRAMAQVCLSCALIAWAWVRIARETGARWAVNLALDSAAIAITDLDGKILRWSNGCERLYGWPSNDALGRIQQQLTGTPPISERDLELLLSGECHEREVTAYRKDGAGLRVLHSRQVVQPRPDLAPMVVHSMTDMTARTHAEQAMLASDTRLSLAVDLHELGIFEWSAATGGFVFHGHAERLFGLEPGQFRGGIQDWTRHLAATFGHSFRMPGPPEAWRVGRHPFRLRAIRAGVPRVVEGTTHVHRGPGPNDISMIGIVMDATEREQRAEMLRSRESELRSILETVPEAMITIDELGHIRSFSFTAETLFGYAAHEVLGKDIRMLLPQYVRPAAEIEVPRPGLIDARPPGADRRSASRPAETRITAGLDRDGNEVPVEIAMGAANIGNEQIAIAFIRNLRDQLATQARLNELREQVLHASRVSAMGEMGAGLAHELNQPLTATSNLLGTIDLMMERDGEATQHRHLLDLARQEVLRAGGIIRRMRAFVSKGDLEIRAEPLDDVIAETLQLARTRNRAPGVRLHYCPDGATPSILADRIQIQQVLVNVINNALDALEGLQDRPPEITIATRQLNDGHIMVSVTDNGPGLPETILGRTFEAFTSTKTNGMGLGLSICRRIVEAHGGRFSVRNIPEGGAAVDFTLPTCTELELKAG